MKHARHGSEAPKTSSGTTPALQLMALGLLFLYPPLLSAGDQPQWGERHTRNMVSEEKGLPTKFDPKTGKNIKWSAALGRNNYSTPVVSGGKVLVAADNSEPRDARHKGDKALLMCLNESDGSLCWQLAVPRTESKDIFLDWPNISMCSVPTVEGDRVYTLTNRFEVVCLDLDGQADGNDGPYRDEGRHMVVTGESPLEVTATDADIVWIVNMPKEIGMYPHDSAFSSILLRGPHLYVNTCNGVDNTHVKIRKPDAPSLIVLDKMTGRLVAKDNERIGPNIFHSTWSSPALGVVGGQPLVFFCGGDGIAYAFGAVDPAIPAGPVRDLERVWRFDCDPTGPKENVHEYNQNRKVSPSNVKSMPVFHKNRLYVTVGGDIWWGKNQSWLQCIDATRTGEITETAKLWEHPLGPHCCSTPAISEGLVFVPDCGGVLHCINAETGEGYWTHELRRSVWGSALVADGKVHVASRRGDFWILAAAKEKRVITEVQFESPIHGSPVAANGVLYVATMRNLYAIQNVTRAAE